MKSYILDDKDQPVLTDDLEACKWREEHSIRRIIGLTRFPDGTRVSTVFLTLDHGWNGGPPILWETMVFDTDDAEYSDYQERYTSQAAAIAGHLEIVGRLLERKPGVKNET